MKRADANARAKELLEAFGLTEAASGRLVKNYSGGMRRRLDIAASIVVTPKLMFLDEPTTGLDPRSRNQVWDIIRSFVAEGTTILLCTQYLDEADSLADGIAVIDHGKVIAEGTPGQLKASVGSGALHVRLLDPEQRPAGGDACWASASARRSTSSPTRPRSRSTAPTPIAAPRRSPSSRARAWASRTSPSASPASTRSSWPSPGARPRTSIRRKRRPRGGAGGMSATPTTTRGDFTADEAAVRKRALLDRAAQAARGRLSGDDLRLARDAQGQARPRAAPRRDDLAGDVRAHVHLPVRRRGRRLDRGVPPVHPPRDPRHAGPVQHGLRRRRP